MQSLVVELAGPAGCGKSALAERLSAQPGVVRASVWSLPRGLLFASAVLTRSARLYRTWRETLRYHRNVAYPYEVRDTRAAVEWFYAHLQELRGATCL